MNESSTSYLYLSIYFIFKLKTFKIKDNYEPLYLSFPTECEGNGWSEEWGIHQERDRGVKEENKQQISPEV